jgi:N-acetylated-alpha-linked acidic dipeptidase
MEKTVRHPQNHFESRQRARSFAVSAVWLLLLITVTLLALCPSVLRKHGVLPASPWHQEPRISQDALTELLLSVPDGQRAREWSTYYTSESHLPGQGRGQAEWTQARWEEFGISDTKVVPYDAYLSYPNGQRLALLDLNVFQPEQVLYEAALVEDPTKAKNPGNGREPFAPAFHSFSADGNATAPYVFANFGSRDDFEALVRANVSLKGKIAVVKAAQVSPYVQLHNLGMFRGSQVLNAQDMGMVGVVVYTDPENDANMIPENGYKPFPDGPARPDTMIERGTLGSVGTKFLSSFLFLLG